MKTVCFCGVDGCGKTTQAKLLFENLQREGKKSIYIHLLSPKNTVFSKLHQTSIINRIINYIRGLRDNFGGVIFKTSLRLFNLLLDSWITTAVNRIKYNKKVEVIIYDRYFYDILVILAFSYPKISYFIINFYKLIAKPDMVILFKINPDVAIKRKPEHTLNEARGYAELYKLLGIKIDSSFIVNAELNAEEISKHIRENMKFIL